jgi:glutamate/tyrosine decarboxylase-like PLP-dependent enzyme
MPPEAPVLDPKFEIGALPEIDIDAVIAPVLRDSSLSPILKSASASELSAQLPRKLPAAGCGLHTVVGEVRKVALDHCRRNGHPGFYGYVASPGLPTDPLAHAVVAAANQNTIGYPGAPGAVTVERTVIDWMRQLAGLPQGAEGAIVSCGSVANLSGLTAALYAAVGDEYLRRGIAGLNAGRPVIVASETAHFSVQRAAVVLGLGVDQVLRVEHDDRFRMRPDRLIEVLEGCESRGQIPVCVVGTAGATVTGAIDPLDEVASICRARSVWFHVDAAYGGAGLLSPGLRSRFRGIEHADSVCMDLHKWFYLGFDGSVVLYRDPRAARNVFYTRSDYVQFPKEGAPEEHMFFHFSPELSRRFRALPAYVAFRHYGGELLGRNVEHNHECAKYLAALAREAEDFELICEPELSICCFRFVPPQIAGDPARVDALNTAVRSALQNEGDYFLSPTDIAGRPVLRVCICSHTTRAIHVQKLVHRIREIGRSTMSQREKGTDDS